MSKVKAVESSSEFQSLLEKSGLLDGSKLEAARQICGASDTAKTAARQLVKDGLLSNWQANQLLGGFCSLIIGNYKLLDQIGKGELGRVYLAQHSKMGNKVALKALSSKSASDPKMVERFLAEARAAGAFEHRNVIRVLDVASDQDRPFVVTEFVSGGDLQQRVDKSGPLSPQDVAEFIAQTAEGMSYVHGKNVLHRDLKPANLLVDNKGVVKILDVGVGHLRQTDKTGSENTGELLLSALGYMSPEQVRGKELDLRSDIYALGGTLYFILTGRVPYTATSDEERNVIRKTKRPVPVTTLKADIPAELASLCDQMMALKPADRPASMDEVARRLREFVLEKSKSVPAEPLQLDEPLQFDEALPLADQVQPGESKLSDTVHKVVADTVPLGASLNKQIIMPTEEDATVAADSPEPSAAVEEIVKIAVNGAEAEPGAAIVVPADLKIQKKKKVAVAESEASTGEVDSPLEAVAKKSKRQRMILIGTAAASLFVILVSFVVMMIIRTSGEDSQLAQTENAKDATAGNSNANNSVPADSIPIDAANVPVPENIPDPQASTGAATAPSPIATPIATPASATPPATAAEATATSNPVVPANASAGTPSSAPTTPAPTTPAPTTPAPTTPAPTTPAPTTPAPTTPAPTTPAPTTPAPTTPAPTTPAPTTPAPAATSTPASVTATTPAAPLPATTPAPAATTSAAEKKTEPTKDAPKAPAPTPPAAKSAKTFEIASAVDLPRLPAADGSAPAEAPAKVLGKANMDPKEPCFLAMYGGEKAMKGRNQFILRNAQNGTAPRDWEFVQKDSSGTEMVIATLALPAQELKFEWTPDGLKNPNATALRNCALKISVGQEKPVFVALRTATKSPPIAVENLDKSALVAKFNLDSIPDPSALRFEPSVANQKTLFEASGPDITKGDHWIVFGEKKDESPLALNLDTSITTKGIQITAVAHVLLPEQKPQRLTPALRKKLPSLADLQKQATNLSAQLAQIKKLSKDEQTKLQTEKSLAELQQKNVDEYIKRVQKLDALIQQLNSNGKLHFRVYYDAGETQVDLVKTDDNAPPASK